MSSVHTMKINKHWFDLIITEDKEYEIRLFDFKRELIKVGEFIEFICNETSRTAFLVVIEITKYDTFKQALENTDLTKVLPGVASIEEAIEIYYDIPGYKEGEEIFGVIVFKIL